jgi:hypothetical protein
MAAHTLSALSAITKTIYGNGIEELWVPECTFAAMVKKSYNFVGESRRIRVQHAPLRGSATYSTAMTNRGVGKYDDFIVTRKKEYVGALIDCETLAAVDGKMGSNVDALKTALRGAAEEFGKALGRKLWGNGGGAVARLAAASSLSTTRLALLDRNDVTKFEVGMIVQGDSTDGTSGAVHPGSAEITAIDETNGYLYTGSNWTAQITGLADSDYLFRDGDFGSAVNLSGILGWIPVTQPSSGDAWFSVDRSKNVPKLAGQRLSGSGGSVLEVAVDAAARAGHFGGKPNKLFLGAFKYAEFAKECMAKGQMAIPVKDARGELTLSGFSIPGPKGAIVVVQDTYCPDSYGLLTNMESWELAGLGQIPHVADDDGREIRMDPTSDSVSMYNRFYGNLLCHRPMDSVIITW